jgi:hypothetical protein
MDSVVIRLKSLLAFWAADVNPTFSIYCLSELKCSTVKVFKFLFIFLSSVSIIESSFRLSGFESL